LYDYLQNDYIKIDFKLFERHFKQTNIDKVKINWLSPERGTLKGLIDKLVDLNFFKTKRQNQLIMQHFYSFYFNTDDTIKTAFKNPKYDNIFQLKDKNNKIVKFLNEIKSFDWK
jgi:hypothetical protein